MACLFLIGYYVNNSCYFAHNSRQSQHYWKALYPTFSNPSFPGHHPNVRQERETKIKIFFAQNISINKFPVIFHHLKPSNRTRLYSALTLWQNMNSDILSFCEFENQQMGAQDNNNPFLVFECAKWCQNQGPFCQERWEAKNSLGTSCIN